LEKKNKKFREPISMAKVELYWKLLWREIAQLNERRE
jgi:hypothetical protein